MAIIQRNPEGENEFTDKIPMANLSSEPTPFVITGFEEKPWGPTLLLVGGYHIELKPFAQNAFIDAFGQDTDDWVGRTANIHLKQFPKGQGRVVEPDLDAPPVDPDTAEVPF